jgi:hypothetical protein
VDKGRFVAENYPFFALLLFLRYCGLGTWVLAVGRYISSDSHHACVPNLAVLLPLPPLPPATPDTLFNLQTCQANAANTDVWLALVRALPANPDEAELLSPSALSHTIVSIYDARVRYLASADSADEALAADSVFDSVASFFSEQLAGDGKAVFVHELTEVDGPVARILMSCRYVLASKHEHSCCACRREGSHR